MLRLQLDEDDVESCDDSLTTITALVDTLTVFELRNSFAFLDAFAY